MTSKRDQDCLHLHFKARVDVARLSKKEGGTVTGFCADVSIVCADCGLPFRFVGLPAGSHHSEPRVSVDGTELRAPIEPATHKRFVLRASYTFPGKDH